MFFPTMTELQRKHWLDLSFAGHIGSKYVPRVSMLEFCLIFPWSECVKLKWEKVLKVCWRGVVENLEAQQGVDYIS